jgi:hypothetical protein
MVHSRATSASEAAPSAADAEAAGSHALPDERTKPMAKVTDSLSPGTKPEAATQDRDAVIAGATRIFREVGVTAGDLRPWARWCPALGELADAMDADAGMAGAR